MGHVEAIQHNAVAVHAMQNTISVFNTYMRKAGFKIGGKNVFKCHSTVLIEPLEMFHFANTKRASAIVKYSEFWGVHFTLPFIFANVFANCVNHNNVGECYSLRVQSRYSSLAGVRFANKINDIKRANTK